MVNCVASISTIESSGAGTNIFDKIFFSALLISTLLLVFLTVHPFPDLSDPRWLSPVGNADIIKQIVVLTLVILLFTFILMRRAAYIPLIASPAVFLVLAAFFVSAVLADNPALSLRRLALAVMIFLMASSIAVFSAEGQLFRRVIALVAAIVLASSFVGVWIIPTRAVHQLSDPSEQILAGNWRGVFSHKNIAGAAMAELIFLSIFLIRSYSRLVGAALLAAAVTFLFFTQSKSPALLVPLALILSALIIHIPAAIPKITIAVAIPFITFLLTVGTIMFEPLAALAKALMTDPSFTGRTEIWHFALVHFYERPFFGHGFQSFWRNAEFVGSWNYQETWALQVGHAHNAYLNIAVMTGLFGLASSLWLILVQPILDLLRCVKRRRGDPLISLFVNMWVFALLLAGFESVFFDESVVWVMTIAAVVGLRISARMDGVR